VIDSGDPYPFRIEVRNAAGTLTNSGRRRAYGHSRTAPPGPATLTNAGTASTTRPGSPRWPAPHVALRLHEPQTALTACSRGHRPDRDREPRGRAEHLNFTAGGTRPVTRATRYILKAVGLVEGKTARLLRRTVTRTLYRQAGCCFSSRGHLPDLGRSGYGLARHL